MGDMVSHMKTTLNIDDTVMRRLRVEVARRDTTMSALVEAGLRRILDESPESAADDPSSLPSWKMGPEFVDVSDREALARAMGDE